MTEFEHLQIEQLKCIADALDGINNSLNNIDMALDKITDCIGFVPPMPHQKNGYAFFRIGGQIDNGN